MPALSSAPTRLPYFGCGARSAARLAQKTSGNLAAQLGLATEELNRRWFQANTGQILTDVQQRFFRPGLKWMAATPDGRVEDYVGCGLCLAQTLEAVCSTEPILALRVVLRQAGNARAGFFKLKPFQSQSRHFPVDYSCSPVVWADPNNNEIVRSALSRVRENHRFHRH